MARLTRRVYRLTMASSKPPNETFLFGNGPVLVLGLVTVAVVALVFREVRHASERVDEVARSTESLRQQIAALQNPPDPGPGRYPERLRAGPTGDDLPPGEAGGPPRGERGQRGGQWQECTGEVAPEVVSRLMSENSLAFMVCYRQRLDENPELAPQVTIEAKVDAEGHLVEARVGAPVQDEAFFECLLELVVRLQFGEVTGGECAVVRLPFDFSSSDEAPEGD